MELQVLVQAIERLVDQHLPHYVDDLRLLCAIDSGSDYKPGLDQVGMFLVSRMQQLGMTTSVIENGLNGNDVVGTLSGHGRGRGKIVLLGHIDTVYPVGVAEQRPLQIKGTRLYAPGASDMKGCILAALYALEAMVSLHYDDFAEICLLCVSDEETSLRHSIPLIQHVCRDSDAVLVLEAARENGAIVSARKGSAWYKLTAQGHAAHAGVEPEKGKNAIVELAHQLLQFYSLQHYLEGVTICPGEIHGGTVPNVVPEFAQARFDLRYLHPADRLIIENIWREMLGKKRVPGVRLQLELEAYRDPMICSQETKNLLKCQRRRKCEPILARFDSMTQGV
ncbi:M20/M25/M40 family metallo-hydrolase [Dictyobacter kobayashii]|uniref:Glutamate carboxypeptidase n=1 Tax=Dictyobacter kobayashii TaxID=2014872 RepID=A0A402AVC0_9CHLR|nr:M20/M25/M40 family metallo-hydrolase [Dictyobacter kobayashii]GCE23081.1 glutamate carboxypeptidase [Dictyobacter kobayashii]